VLFGLLSLRRTGRLRAKNRRWKVGVWIQWCLSAMDNSRGAERVQPKKVRSAQSSALASGAGGSPLYSARWLRSGEQQLEAVSPLCIERPRPEKSEWVKMLELYDVIYPAAQGEFHLLAGRPTEAAKHFERAMELVPEPVPRRIFSSAR
jgi:hypothetical protein